MLDDGGPRCTVVTRDLFVRVELIVVRRIPERTARERRGNSEFPTRPTCFRWIALKVDGCQYVSMTVFSYGMFELRL